MPDRTEPAGEVPSWAGFRVGDLVEEGCASRQGDGLTANVVLPDTSGLAVRYTGIPPEGQFIKRWKAWDHATEVVAT